VQITIDTEAIAAVGGAIAGVVGTLSLAWVKVVKPVRAWMEEWRLFREDWNGELARPGVDGRDGVMVRLAAIEGELKPNGGGSMRDAVNRLGTDMRAHLASHDVTVPRVRPVVPPED
jgi:hypothetical protein